MLVFLLRALRGLSVYEQSLSLLRQEFIIKLCFEYNSSLSCLWDAEPVVEGPNIWVILRDQLSLLA